MVDDVSGVSLSLCDDLRVSLATRTLDLPTRYFWRVVGRQIDVTGSERWLDSPANDIEARGDGWLDALVRRTDHWLKLGPWRALQLHYRLDRA